MGQILTPAVGTVRRVDHAAADAAHAALLGALAARAAVPRSIEAQAIAANGVPGYTAWHGLNGGECANTLDTLPVLVKYELTADRMGNDVAEVVAVSICGHTIDAQDFSNDIRAAWGADCMAARVKAGVL